MNQPVQTEIPAFGGGCLLRNPRTGRFVGSTRGLGSPRTRAARREARLAVAIVPVPGCVVRRCPDGVHVRGLDERASPGAYAGATIRVAGRPTRLGRCWYKSGRDAYYAAT